MHENSMARRMQAFTLIELLLAIAILGVLVSLVAISLRAVAAQAGRTDSLSALRQMVLAHSGYTADHRGQLMPGYISPALLAPNGPFERLVVKLPTGYELAPEDKSSYVWRLAPYVDHAWDTFFADMRDAGALSAFQADYGDGLTGAFGPYGGGASYAGGISERPSYGLNSIFVGGDCVHGSPSIIDRHPWQNLREKIAATRLTEVLNPSRLVVFAPTAKADPTLPKNTYIEPEAGFCELRPPYVDYASTTWIEPQWMVSAAGRISKTTHGDYSDPSGAGLPIDRSGGEQMPVGNLDGSTGVEAIKNLAQDMRRWDPFEQLLRRTQQAFPP